MTTLEQTVYKPADLIPILQLGKNTIGELLRSGKLRSIRVGRTYRIPREAVQDFLNGRVN